jgi:alpha-L-fucosidase
VSATLQRDLPSWYDEAKLGVMVHWGPYAVPAWAERAGTLQELWAGKGPRYYFEHNPYAEWYANTMRINGSGAQRHHIETYGKNATYADFIPAFQDGIARADFGAWAELFAEAGARYCVFVTKHMDGFLLWPSTHQPPDRRYVASRDVVGGLTEAVRARGMRMGLYYSGGYDGLFNGTVIRDLASAVRGIPTSRAYAGYCSAHFDELIERYQPAILWNDIAYPGALPRDELFERYYRAVPDGVVNERWTALRMPANLVARAALSGALRAAEAVWPLLPAAMRTLRSRPAFHHDFRTPEYETHAEPPPYKWEAVRGLGQSFGNNRMETDEDMLSPDDLVHLLVDVVSKGGNLLLGVAADANGEFPEAQAARLRALGRWLEANGEAIFGTRPWTRTEGETPDGIPQRFTQRDGAVYAIVLEAARAGPLVIEGLRPAEEAEVSVLGCAGAVAWERLANGVSVTVPEGLELAPAFAVRVSRTR